MRAVVQRVRSASVTVGAERVGRIGRGLLVYLGVGRADGPQDVEWTVQKLATLRVFEDDAGRVQHDLTQVGGSVLVVSQFTLFGDVRRGRRPSFEAAAPAEQALALYDAVCTGLRERGLPVETGRFQATMQVVGEVDGPFTLILDSRQSGPAS